MRLSPVLAMGRNALPERPAHCPLKRRCGWLILAIWWSHPRRVKSVAAMRHAKTFSWLERTKMAWRGWRASSSLSRRLICAHMS